MSNWTKCMDNGGAYYVGKTRQGRATLYAVVERMTGRVTEREFGESRRAEEFLRRIVNGERAEWRAEVSR